jgi:hypothetical protein
MPRFTPRQAWRAEFIHPFVGALYPVARSIRAAQQELKWIEQEVLDSATRKGWKINSAERLLEEKISLRARGVPLQYVLGENATHFEKYQH